MKLCRNLKKIKIIILHQLPIIIILVIQDFKEIKTTSLLGNKNILILLFILN